MQVENLAGKIAITESTIFVHAVIICHNKYFQQKLLDFRIFINC